MTMIRGNGIESKSIEHAANSQRGASKIISRTKLIPYQITRIYTHSIQGFSSCLKTYQLNQYEVECYRANCYVCQQHLQNLCVPLSSSFPISIYYFNVFLFFILLVFLFFFFFFVLYICSCSYIIMVYFVLFVCLKLTFQFCRIRW